MNMPNMDLMRFKDYYLSNLQKMKQAQCIKYFNLNKVTQSKETWLNTLTTEYFTLKQQYQAHSTYCNNQDALYSPFLILSRSLKLFRSEEQLLMYQPRNINVLNKMDLTKANFLVGPTSIEHFGSGENSNPDQQVIKKLNICNMVTFLQWFTYPTTGIN